MSVRFDECPSVLMCDSLGQHRVVLLCFRLQSCPFYLACSNSHSLLLPNMPRRAKSVRLFYLELSINRQQPVITCDDEKQVLFAVEKFPKPSQKFPQTGPKISKPRTLLNSKTLINTACFMTRSWTDMPDTHREMVALRSRNSS